MCRLRQGFPEDHLAQLFNESASAISRIFITWVNFMFFKFGQINIWPSRKVINKMPKSFKGRYKSTRVIIDCTEVRCQMPSSLQLNWELFSAYKNHTTLKGLVGISPSGAVTFRSQLYTGSISNREIVRQRLHYGREGIHSLGFVAFGSQFKFATLSWSIFSDGCRRCGKNTGNCKFTCNLPLTRLRIFTSGTELFYYIIWEL